MPRKVVKGTTENLNMLREKVDYIGFELGEVPEFLKDFEPLEYRVPKVYDETTYKVYKYVKIKDIEIISERERNKILYDFNNSFSVHNYSFFVVLQQCNSNHCESFYYLHLVRLFAIA